MVGSAEEGSGGHDESVLGKEARCSMKCPHCLVSFHESWDAYHIGQDNIEEFAIRATNCPSCKTRTIELVRLRGVTERGRTMVYPKGISRAPLSAEVPPKFAEDYKEACRVLPDSAKASAALSRRCLQVLLREAGKAKPSDLSKEIDQVLSSLPSHLAEAVDAARNIGNFAAHPIKSTNTGEIVDVEPGEAEWLLEVLEGLFDFYFVHPAVLQQKRDALNKKLTDAGKPPMK